MKLINPFRKRIKVQFNAADYFGCGFYRMMMPCSHLNYKDFKTSFQVKDKRYPLKYDTKADVIVTQWNIDKEDLKTYKNLQGLKVLDLDDFLHGKVTITSESIEYNPFQLDIIDQFIHASDVITCSTEYLKMKYIDKNKNIVVLPNQIDFKVFNRDAVPFVRNEQNKDKIVIGFAGSYTHYRDLKIPLQAVKNIMQENKNVIFCMIGFNGKVKLDVGNKIEEVDLLDGFDRNRVSIYDWTNDFRLHANRLALFDIGICPLIDNEFNRSKSPVKFLELSAMGIPSVCSDVEPYKSVQNKLFLAKTKGMIYQDWCDKLRLLVNDANYRKQVSQIRYQFVKDNYDIEKNVHRWENVYRNNK